MLIRKTRSKTLGEAKRSDDKQEAIKILIFFLFSFFYSLSTNAQCAMCRAALESEGNNNKAEAVNDGIVYLMVIPYLIVGVVGFFVYRMYTNKDKVKNLTS
jgi:amino acid permease